MAPMRTSSRATSARRHAKVPMRRCTRSPKVLARRLGTRACHCTRSSPSAARRPDRSTTARASSTTHRTFRDSSTSLSRRGAANTAGEIGHWPVAFQLDATRAASDGIPRCGCGSFGCVESFAGGRNMAERYGVADAAEVFAAASRDDPRAKAIVELAERALASLAVGLVNALSPSVIVVGGSIAEKQPRRVLDPMRLAIAQRAFRAPAAAVRVEPAALGGDVGTVGAVLAARERVSGKGEWFL